VSASFQVVVIRPPGYAHSGALAEIAETLVGGLRRLDHQVSVEENRMVPGSRAVLLGAHLLRAEHVARVPADTIVYNLEQADPASPVWTPHYISLLRRLEVWDYSRRNIERLAGMGVTGRVKHVPVGYVPELTRITSQLVEDIDVLFYGSPNKRRAWVIGELRDMGLNVQTVFGVYGAGRDAFIARTKVVLNLHFYDTSIFEIVRVSYLLANQKAVVSECHPGTEIDKDLVDAVKLAPYEELACACRDLVQDGNQRRELAARGFQRMTARDEARILQTVLGEG